MGRYDDDYLDDDNQDEEDEDSGIGGSTSNPFSKGGGASVRGAGLPTTPRPSLSDSGSGNTFGRGGDGDGGGGNAPSPLNRPSLGGSGGGGSGSGGSPLPPARPPLGGGNAPSPLNRPSLGGSGSGGAGSGSSAGGSGGSGGNAFNRPALGGERAPLGGGDRSSGGGDRAPLGGGERAPLGGDRPSPPQRSPAFGSNDDDRKPSAPPARDDSGAARALGGLGNKLGVGSKDDDSKKDDAKAGGGSLGSRLNPFGNKKEDPPANARPQGADKDAKPAASGGAAAGGGIGGRLPSLPNLFGGAKKEDAPAGKDNKASGDKPSGVAGAAAGALAGVTSRLPFGGGAKKDDADKKDDAKPAGGGGLGGLASGLAGRLPFGGGKKDESSNATPPPKPASASGGGGAASNPAFGGGAKPATPATPSAGGGGFGSGNASMGGAAGARPSPPAPTGGGAPAFGGSGGTPSAFGAARPGTSAPTGAAATPAKTTAAKPAKAATGVSFMDRLRALNPLAATTTSKDKAAKARTSKGVKVEQEGLTLDNKLDILGIGLVITALVLLLSSLSPTKGAITQSINDSLSYTFGWGAVAVVAILFAVGVWLLARHFGDEAPSVSTIRIVGFAMTMIAGLTAAQFIDASNYVVGVNQDYLNTVRNVFLPIAYNLGRGGGYVGGEVYYLMLSNFGEVGGFLVVVLVLIIGMMLLFNLSIADFAVIVISNLRNIRDAYSRRSQRVSAVRMEKMRALDAAAMAAAIAAPKPILEPALPAGVMPSLPQPIMAALPAVTAAVLPPDEKRSISITTGGRTSRATFSSGENAGIPVAMPEAVPVTSSPAFAPAAFNPTPAPAPAPAKPGGFLGGLRGGNKPETSEKPAVPAAASGSEPAKSAGGLFGRFGRGRADEAATPSPAPAPMAPATPGIAASVAGAAAVGLAGGVGAVIGAAGAAGGVGNGQAPSAPQMPMPATPARPVPMQPAAQQPTGAPAIPFGGGAPVATPSPFAQPSAAPTSPPVAPAAQQQPAAQAPTPPAFGGAGQMPPPATTSAAASQPDVRAGDLLHHQQTTDPITTERLPSQPFERPAVQGTGGTPTRPMPPPYQRPPLAAGLKPVLGSDGDGAVAASPPVATPPPAATPLAPAARLEDDSAVDKSRLPSFKGTADLYAPAPRENRPASAPVAAAGAHDSLEVPPPPQPARGALAPEQEAQLAYAPRSTVKEWRAPNLATLLVSGVDQDVDHELLLRRARIIEETLASFASPGRVVDVRTGPVVTQFGVEPDYLEVRGGKRNRVKVSAIAALDKDLQLALGARSIRIEAPVPGKGYVGIEVPNEKAEVVRMRDVLESEQFKKMRLKSPLAIALGQGVDGTPVVGDLASMPHLLIAGTTGSGKSVCVNTIISSMLLHNTPKQLKFIMVDPKRVELTQYNGIPHLIAPVVVELERIVSVLKWVTREMDERYRKFSMAAARNIEDYNKHLPTSEEPMAYIVVIIDELADLMMLAPDDTERVITRIAALARATGIHLVIATQRPSVDVVTGLIKANFPARIAFAVAGSVDSRVILDQPGAERLLGRGDMLYVSGDAPAPQRLQGVYMSDDEISNVTRFWRGQVTDAELLAMSKPMGATLTSSDDAQRGTGAASGTGNVMFSRQANGSTSGTMPWDRSPSTTPSKRNRDDDDDSAMNEDVEDNDDVGDEMYEQAVDMVRRLNRASVSLLQRRLRIGYTRAARLIDLMEERGIVGPAVEGSKPREVIPLK